MCAVKIARQRVDFSVLWATKSQNSLQHQHRSVSQQLLVQTHACVCWNNTVQTGRSCKHEKKFRFELQKKSCIWPHHHHLVCPHHLGTIVCRNLSIPRSSCTADKCFCCRALHLSLILSTYLPGRITNQLLQATISMAHTMRPSPDAHELSTEFKCPTATASRKRKSTSPPPPPINTGVVSDANESMAVPMLERDHYSKRFRCAPSFGMFKPRRTAVQHSAATSARCEVPLKTGSSVHCRHSTTSGTQNQKSVANAALSREHAHRIVALGAKITIMQVLKQIHGNVRYKDYLYMVKVEHSWVSSGLLLCD